MKKIILLMIMISVTGCGLQLAGVDVGRLVDSGAQVYNAFNIDAKKERQIGGSMAATLLGATPLSTNKKAQTYVNNLGGWLAHNSGAKDIQWNFAVIQDPAVNAFAAPGGYIFVTEGILAELQNEAELAAVLSHEIAHVVRQHHLNAVKETALRGALTTAGFAALDTYNANNATSMNQYRNSAIVKQLVTATNDLYTTGLVREDELDADKIGLQIMSRSGYDPYAFISVLQILQGIDPGDSGLKLLFKTHPNPADRIKAIEKHLGQVSKQTKNMAVLEKRFKQNIR